jgi:hypothetical protein
MNLRTEEWKGIPVVSESVVRPMLRGLWRKLSCKQRYVIKKSNVKPMDFIRSVFINNQNTNKETV